MPVVLNLSINSFFPRARRGRTSLRAWGRPRNPTAESTCRISIPETAETSSTTAPLRQTFTAGTRAAREERPGLTLRRAVILRGRCFRSPPFTLILSVPLQSWDRPATAAVLFRRSVTPAQSQSALNALHWKPAWRSNTVAALGLKWLWVLQWQPTARRNSPSTGRPSKESPLMPTPSKGQICCQRQTTIHLNL